MLYTSKNAIFYVFLIITIFLNADHPARASDVNFEEFPFGQINSRVSDIPTLAKAFRFLPSGAPKQANRPQCSARSIAMLINSSMTAAEQSVVLQEYFNRCGKHLSRWKDTTYGSVGRMLDTTYEFKNLPVTLNIKEVKITLADREHTKVRALLAQKNSTEKRPLIIAVCGTECNTPDTIPKQILMSVFDASPFNVLILASDTGYDFISDNGKLDIGGLTEGAEAYQIARLVSQPPSDVQTLVSLNKVTSSIHILGVSLGGHSSLYAGLYASANPFPQGSPQIQSVLAYCPVVNLGATLQSLDDRSTREADYFQQEIWGLLSSHRNLVKDLPSSPPSNHDFRSLIADAIKQRYVERSKFKDFLPPFENASVVDDATFWNYSDFSKYYDQVKIPTLILGAENDPIVDPEFNSLAMKDLLRTHPSSNLGVVTTPYGVHCSTGMAYGWDVFTSFVTNYFLSHSPEFDVAGREQSYALENLAHISGSFDLYDDEMFYGQEWSLSPGAKSATLTVNILSPHGAEINSSFSRLCSNADPDHDFADSCFRQVVVKVPLSAVFKNPPEMKNPSLIESTTRFLNGRVYPINEQGGEIISTIAPPTKLLWYRD